MTATQRNVSEQQARQVAEAARESEWRKPSFGKELFLGRFRLDLIDPWPAEQSRPDADEFLRRLAEFASDEMDGAQIEHDARVPDEVFQGLGRVGAFVMKIDKEHGELGLSDLHYCRALTLVGSASAAVGALVSARQSI